MADKFFHTAFTGSFLALALTAIYPNIAQADHPRPYFGIESGINILVDGSSYPVITIGIEAEGWATQVGRYNGNGTIVLNVNTGEALLAEYTSTARNGDQLFADLESTPIDDKTLLVRGTITGGTGRFAGASGQYWFWLEYDLPSTELPNSYDAVFFGHLRR